MSTASEDEFLSALATQISRNLNTLTPNVVLAKRLFALSRSHPSLPAFSTAIASFGKFSPADASDLWDKCQSEDIVEAAFEVPGLTITDSEVMEPEKPSGHAGLTVGVSTEKHVFKAPPRASALGLDRLAMEKRKERGEAERAGPVKRIKYDDEEEAEGTGEFKGESSLSFWPGVSTFCGEGAWMEARALGRSAGGSGESAWLIEGWETLEARPGEGLGSRGTDGPGDSPAFRPELDVAGGRRTIERSRAGLLTVQREHVSIVQARRKGTA